MNNHHFQCVKVFELLFITNKLQVFLMEQEILWT